MEKMKQIAFRMPEPVKSLILSEPESLEFSEFIVKIGTWDKLLKMHEEAQK
jgi:hypothetical protein